MRYSSCRYLSSSLDLSFKMKNLNDNRQFKKAIDLYESEIKKETTQNTSLAVNQALRSCIELADIKRGKDIHKNLSVSMMNNPFIQANLVRLYSKWSK